MKKLMVFFLSILFTIACTEKYSLDENIDTNRIVIEGVINSDSIHYDSEIIYIDHDAFPAYVRVSKVSPTLETNSSLSPGNNVIAINDAIVIIYDNMGNSDTLSGLNTINHNGNNGYYLSRKMIGYAGRTYFLKVLYNNQEYTAEAYMPPLLTIDSMKIPDSFFSKGPNKNFTEGIKIFFKEQPNTKDYYMFKIHHGDLMLTLVDDQFLSPNIVNDGFTLDDGENSRYWVNNYLMLESQLHAGLSITVSASSITKSTYDYYRVLMNQFNNDGGVLSPTPASAKGNISNGALGIFRASSRSYISGKR